MRPYVAEVIAGSAWFDETILFDRRSADAQLRSEALVKRLRAQQLESVLLMTNSLRTAYFAWRSQIPQRIGYVRYGRGPLLTERLYPPRQGWRLTPVSAVDYYLQLTGTLGAPVTSRQLNLNTTWADEQRADAIHLQLGIAAHETVVALNTGGAYGAAKEWPVEYFAQLARRLTETHPLKVLVICGPSERAKAADIVARSGSDRVLSLADHPLSIGLSKAMIRRSQLLISTDSGPRHFGAAFQVPTVTLFGATDPRWSHNFHSRTIELQRHVPCGPCAKRTCPLKHHRCMRDLSVDQVYRAALSLLPLPAEKQVA